MGERNTTRGAWVLAVRSPATGRPRREAPYRQVGYLVLLAIVSVGIMFAGLGVLDVILDSVPG